MKALRDPKNRLDIETMSSLFYVMRQIRPSNSASSREQIVDNCNYSENEQDIDKSAADMREQKTHDPENEKHHRNRVNQTDHFMYISLVVRYYACSADLPGFVVGRFCTENTRGANRANENSNIFLELTLPYWLSVYVALNFRWNQAMA